MASREFSWHQLVVQADPDWNKDSRIVTEYEFTAKGIGNPRTHENGYRVFKGDYQTRGPYEGTQYHVLLDFTNVDHSGMIAVVNF